METAPFLGAPYKVIIKKPHVEITSVRLSVIWYQRLNRLSNFREILLKNAQQARVL
jgi:hypothetical protein